MNFFFIVFLISISFSQTFNYFPFDWGGQFGYLNYKGRIFWNQDWRSEKLLFDGTWAIYPKMFGKEIEDGFITKKSEPFDYKIKTIPESYFIYKQGDYNLDKFLFGLEYGSEKRLIKLNGFKRTFSGDVGQYYNNTYQPNQQSYLASYESLNNDEHSGLSIGHFNTFTGLILLDQKGIIDNRITTSNLFWEKKYNNLTIKFNMDNFLQRYNARHSVAIFLGPRYLTRTQYQSTIIYNINEHYYFSFGLGMNTRNVRMDNNDLDVDWKNIYVSYNSKFVQLKSEIITEDKNYYYSHEIKIQKKLGRFTFDINRSSKFYPIHPYYIIGNEMKSNYRMLKNKKSNNLELYFEGESNTFSFILSHMEDDKNFWEATLLYPYANENAFGFQNQEYQYYFLRINGQIRILSDFRLYLSLIQQDPNNIYSGNRRKEGNLGLEKNISLFENFLDLKFNGELKIISDEHYDLYSNIDLIEMVPVYNYNMDYPYYTYDNEFEDFALFNANIEASVASFKIIYDMKNLNQVIGSIIGYKNHNNISVHHQIPQLGSHMSLTIEWYFQD